MLCFNSFNIGAISLHGPHHSAKKSTKTGLPDCIISPKLLMRMLFYFFKFNFAAWIGTTRMNGPSAAYSG
jgi:hypothetical protein